MFGHNFYYAYFRKYIAIFGTIFNDIHITRTRDDTTTQTLKIPLMYSSMDKMLDRLNSDPDLSRKVAAFSPAIAFEHGPPMYDASRKLQTTLERCITDSTGTKTQFIGIPYNIEFTLFIYSKEEEDGLMVLEQILPFFTPSLTLSVTMDAPLNYKIDVPIILSDINFTDNSFGQFEDRRSLLWTLKFLMKAEFGGPITTTPRVMIKQVYSDIRDTDTRDLMEEVYVQPGLTANGQPTTIEANSVPIANISSTNSWGYVVEIIPGPNRHS
jgi:hypothetical protein